ncbi:MAG: hypothetical protein K5795_02140 [Lachnospiraceae bacterium]|nr:hypothetical protein [Lachnospiraceae bacterium]
MKKALSLKKVLKGFRRFLISAFLVFWSIGMLLGGFYGLAAVAVGIPAALCFNVFEF